MILDAPACPAISEVALFRSVAPVPVAAPRSSDATLISPRDWKVVTATAPGAEALLDGDGATIWSQPAPTTTPAGVTLDFGTTQTVAGFSLTPWRHPDKVSAPPRNYRAETSIDGKTWTAAADGEFQNIAYALATQRIPFTAPRPLRYLRLTFAATSVPAEKLAIADIGAFTR